MTTRVISDYITPADEIQTADGEITADNLLDEVSLYNLYDTRESPEQDAERILSITYPTETLTTIIERTAEKFDASSSVSEGAHIIGGEFGSGKSHIELVLYHLLSSPELGQRWIGENSIDATLPSNSQTAALQMLNLDRDYDTLHVAVGDYLDIDEWDEGDPPTVHEIRDALDDHPTAVFIDEFERWFGMSGRAEYRDDNLGFLQNLLEAAGRDDTPLTVYVSLLFKEADVEAILPRTNPFRHDLSRRRDEKIRFLLHRLIGEVTAPDALAALAFFRQLASGASLPSQITVTGLEDVLYRADEEELDAVVRELRDTLRAKGSFSNPKVVQFVFDGDLVDDDVFTVRIERDGEVVYLPVGNLFVEEPNTISPGHAVARK